ncbi:MAG: SIR2 family protein [Clostridiales bacterium]|nr:SIR2 family protein [Clostridiales bacterium]
MKTKVEVHNKGRNKKTDIESFLGAIENFIADVSNQKVKSSIMQYCGLLRNEFLIYGNPEDEDPKGIKDTFIETLKLGKLAFVLGAGISMSPPFNLPNWSQLLKYAVIDEFLSSYEVGGDIKFNNIYNILVEESGSDSKDYFGSFDLYELGEFLENCRRDANRQDYGSSSIEIERKTDYEMYGFVERALKRKLKSVEANDSPWVVADTGRLMLKKNLDQLQEEKKIVEAPLIDYLSSLTQSQKIKRIITYNYDNAFEYLCQENNISVKSVFVDDQLPDAEINGQEEHVVYHIHGFVPIFNECNAVSFDDIDRRKKSNEVRKLILSEGSYDDMAHASYKWRNTVQIDTFLRYNCLFFGFSATDINFKRIVKLMDWHTEYAVSGGSTESPVKHFIFMTADDFIKNIFGKKWLTIKSNKKIMFKKHQLHEQNLDDLDAKLKLLYFTLRLKRKYLRRMHLYPIWMTIHGSRQYVENMFQIES